MAYRLLDLIERIAIMERIWRLHNESHVFRLKVFSAILGWQEYKSKTIKSMCLKMTLPGDSFLFSLFYPSLSHTISVFSYYSELTVVQMHYIERISSIAFDSVQQYSQFTHTMTTEPIRTENFNGHTSERF